MKIGVMMPAYNVGRYIGEAIQCVKNQTHRNWFLVIYDDGSTDDTYEQAMLHAVDDQRIKVIKGPKNQGCPVARNVCLKELLDHPQVVFIARLDADDLDDPRRFQLCHDYLNFYRNYHLVSTRFSWLHLNGKLERRTDGGKMDTVRYLQNAGGRPCSASVFAWAYVYRAVGYFDPKLTAGSDGEWMFRCCRQPYNWGFLDEHLYIQRRHPDQISQRLRTSQQQTHMEAWKKHGLVPPT